MPAKAGFSQSQGMGVPALRFDGFTGSWEQRKFSEITYPAGEKNRDNLPLESYSITNESGFVPQNEKFENGGTMREADKRMYYIVSPQSFAYNPARINVGSIGYQNLDKNVIVSSLYEVFKTTGVVDDRFLWHWFKSTDFQKLIEQLQEGGVRLYFYYDKLCQGKISLPSKAEQQRIGTFLDHLDHLITLVGCECEKLEQIKAAMLEQIFPQNGETEPRLRFDGFTGPWAQHKLGEMYQVNNERNEGQYPVEKTLSVATMTFNPSGNGADETSLSKYKVLRIGDIAFEGHTSKEFRYGRFVLNNLENGIMSPRFTTLRPIVQQDFNFWEYYVHSERVMRSRLVNATKAGTMMNELVPDDLFNQTIFVPSLAEQAKIGMFLKYLDRFICLHKKKCEKLKQIKQALLSQMFV